MGNHLSAAIVLVFILAGAARADRVHDLARRGDMKEMTRLLAASPELVHAKETNDTTPLHHAADRGYKEMCSLLLNKGADIDAQAKSGSTPLTSALASNRGEVAILLIGRGAKLDTTYFDSSRGSGGYTPLHIAMRTINAKVVKLLLDKGADVNARSDREETPLYVLVRDMPRYRVTDADTKVIASILINAKADVTLTAKGGDTALHRAVAANLLLTSQVLVDAGADVNATTDAGLKPLTIAMKNGDPKMIKYLKDKGATE
jgi:ankyrin repeat protein